MLLIWKLQSKQGIAWMNLGHLSLFRQNRKNNNKSQKMGLVKLKIIKSAQSCFFNSDEFFWNETVVVFQKKMYQDYNEFWDGDPKTWWPIERMDYQCLSLIQTNFILQIFYLEGKIICFKCLLLMHSNRYDNIEE